MSEDRRIGGMNDERARFWLALVLIVIVSSSLWALFMLRVPESNRESLALVLGALLAKLTDVYGFHFNSSASSRQKDVTIGALAHTAQTAGEVLATKEDEHHDPAR